MNMVQNNSTSVDIPDGTSGEWSVTSFTVTPDDEASQRIRSFNPSSHGRWVPAGTYKSINRSGRVIMSNTPNEIRDLITFKGHAIGNVLINGLGLGVALRMVLDKKDHEGNLVVKHVTVIEKSKDVIKLVAPWFEKNYQGRVTIVECDAFEYKPNKNDRYDAVWHDIWDDICTDNLDGMKKLVRKYCRKATWQGCWCRELLRVRSRYGL